MKPPKEQARTLLVLALTLVVAGAADAQQFVKKPSSYSSVVEEDFATVMKRMKAAKSGIEKRQADLLKQRYDLFDHPALGVTMSRGKAV